jgi:uncharacterized repeat protein (TIGR03803 family)
VSANITGWWCIEFVFESAQPDRVWDRKLHRQHDLETVRPTFDINFFQWRKTMKQNSNTRIYRWTTALASLSIAILLVVCPASAQTEQKLYDFCSRTGCTDGQYPNVKLVRDPRGNLVGTTTSGGAHNQGTVFRINASGVEKVLYSFCAQQSCADGASPFDGLIMDKSGNFYGTTYSGGAHGQGTVFKINASGIESVLYSFCAASGCSDGANPYAGVVMDTAGNLYGTTLGGGSLNNGTVFELTAAGGEIVLHAFQNTPDFATPYGGLVRDTLGNLYGTTWFGGANGAGGVFEVSPSQTETRLYDKWCALPCTQDGNSSGATLILSKGNLFGTSVLGGAFGHGLVFEVNIRSKKETILYSFDGVADADGAAPFAGLIMDTAGNLYGTTTGGGVSGCGGLQDGCGAVFKLSPSGTGWTESILHSFANDATDGVNPFGGLIIDSQSNLYGTTRFGGLHNSGTVFKITP